MARKLPVTDALAELGYRLVEGRNYRASWSSPEVEHFIYLQGGNTLSGAPPSARFGLRNTEAELFAVECVTRYGWAFIRTTLDRRKKTDCLMQFDFSRLDPHYLRKPLVQGLTSKADLFAALLSDEEQFRWRATNSAIRAAIIVALGSQVGVEPREIRSELRSKAALISNGLSKHSPFFDTPDDYVAKVQEDWAARGC
jgi:hypothetical protein